MALLAFGCGPSTLMPPRADTADFLANTTAAQIAPYVTVGTKKTADGTQNWPELTFTDSADFWISFYSYEVSTGNDSQPLYIMDGDTQLFRLDRDTSATLCIEYWNGSAWVEVAADVSYSLSTRYRHDIHIVMDNTVGVIDWYLDGTIAQSFSGDTIRTSSTTCNRIVFYNNTGTGSNEMTISAVMVANEDLRTWEYGQKLLNGAGGLSDWTGAYTTVDDTTVDDTDFMYSGTTADQSTFACAGINSTLTSGYDVVAVGVSARGKLGRTNALDLKLLARSGTSLGASSTQTMDITFDTYQGIFATDPATASAWTASAADSAQIGVESV